jgi:hypothetical protein
MDLVDWKENRYFKYETYFTVYKFCIINVLRRFSFQSTRPALSLSMSLSFFLFFPYHLSPLSLSVSLSLKNILINPIQFNGLQNYIYKRGEFSMPSFFRGQRQLFGVLMDFTVQSCKFCFEVVINKRGKKAFVFILVWNVLVGLNIFYKGEFSKPFPFFRGLKQLFVYGWISQ